MIKAFLNHLFYFCQKNHVMLFFQTIYFTLVARSCRVASSFILNKTTVEKSIKIQETIFFPFLKKTWTKNWTLENNFGLYILLMTAILQVW